MLGLNVHLSIHVRAISEDNYALHDVLGLEKKKMRFSSVYK